MNTYQAFLLHEYVLCIKKLKLYQKYTLAQHLSSIVIVYLIQHTKVRIDTLSHASRYVSVIVFNIKHVLKSAQLQKCPKPY